MSMVLVLWKKLELALRLSQAVPSLDEAVAFDHAAAAIDAARPEVPPELLLAIAYVESRFDPTSTSRIVDSVRRTGSYPSTKPPRGLSGTLYCGPLQTYAATWKRCLASRRLAVGYGNGAEEIAQWLRDRRVAGKVSRALLGHGCGNHGVTTGKCNKYPDRVLAFARKLAWSTRAARSVM